MFRVNIVIIKVLNKVFLLYLSRSFLCCSPIRIYKIMCVNYSGCTYSIRFFAQTLLHQKILMTNNMQKRDWPNDLICKVCTSYTKTSTHHCKVCPYTKKSGVANNSPVVLFKALAKLGRLDLYIRLYLQMLEERRHMVHKKNHSDFDSLVNFV